MVGAGALIPSPSEGCVLDSDKQPVVDGETEQYALSSESVPMDQVVDQTPRRCVAELHGHTADAAAEYLVTYEFVDASRGVNFRAENP